MAKRAHYWKKWKIVLVCIKCALSVHTHAIVFEQQRVGALFVHSMRPLSVFCAHHVHACTLERKIHLNKTKCAKIFEYIWNPVQLDRIKQNHTYWYTYVLVRTSTWQYKNFTSVHGSTYWYLLVCALERTCGLFTHPSRVFSLIQQCTAPMWGIRHDDSKFPKVQSSENHSTYSYVLVRTGTLFIWITLYPLSDADESPLNAWLVPRA